MLTDLRYIAVQSELITGLSSVGLYLVRIAKGDNAQGPEAAEHGEDRQAQVVTRGECEEVVFTLTIAGAVTLEETVFITNN